MTEEKKAEFLELYSEQERRLTAFALALTRNRDDAKDLVSESVLRAYESFDKIESKQAFASYLFSIASRLHKRRIWRRRLFGDWDQNFADNLPAQEIDPGNRVDVAALYKALAKLPEKVKEALVLFEINGFSIREIEQIQDSSNSAVKLRLKRGREKLTSLMQDHESVKRSWKIHKITASGEIASINNIENIQLRIGNEKL